MELMEWKIRIIGRNLGITLNGKPLNWVKFQPNSTPIKKGLTNKRKGVTQPPKPSNGESQERRGVVKG